LKLTKWANEKHHRLEREVLKNADIIVCVSNSNKEKLNLKAKVDIRVVTNGFDDVDVSFLSSPVEKKFSLAHIGTFMANRNPEILWDVLSDMILENKQFRQDFILRLVGKTDSVILNNLTNKGLAPFVHVEEPVSHNEAIQLQKSAQVLLLTVNKTGDSKGMVTGKVFEYLVSGRPILAIGPSDGDLAKILKETGTGVISDFNDKADLKKKLESYYMQFKRNTLTVNPKNTEKYSRKNLTREMADIINSLVK
jgi:glycosyltransferase involved in cell wall biosynthesis